ncbi:conserved exported hypothetical protein [Micromonospora lupini str. Lupac 08]|uniref:Gram-positive cocci surface proteins LPxTG domain-containing protein n=1 Tax=Micromonospora lupini str. Lupac 08 TaxID=1150864 RepID=I0KW68_9ACTN|nr:conserved exported hypothetical protein [Micromonospora lupini str. Lupac 08]
MMAKSVLLSKRARLTLPPLAGLAALLALTLVVAQPGAAEPRAVIDPVAPAQGFLVMTQGNGRLLGSENEGTVAIGGNLSFSNYQVATNTAGSFIVQGDTNPTALVVGGRVDFAGSVPGTRLQVLQNGYVKVGDLTGAFVRNVDNNGALVNTRVLPTNDYDASPRVELVTRQPVPSVGPASPIDFAAAFASFRQTAGSLATCLQNVVLRTPEGAVLPRPIPPGSNAVVTLTPGVTNTLNLSATDLANIGTFTFATQPTADTPLLVNVDTTGVADEFVWQAPNFSGIGGPQARFILFNFPTATSVTLTDASATIEGTIYAPNADLNALTNSNIEGSVISRTLLHDGGEIHNFPFSTTLNCQQPTPSPTVTPTGSPTTTPTQTPTPSPTVSPTAPTPSPTQPTPTFPPQPTPTQPPLPVTGPASLPLAGTGAVLTGVGLTLLLLATKRRRTQR